MSEANRPARGLADDLTWLAARLAGNADAERPAPQSAVSELAGRLRLSDFERDVLLLAVGFECAPSIADAVAALDPRRPWPHLGLALRLFEHGDPAAIAPTGALRHFGLVDLVGNGSLLSRPLAVDERVVFALHGIDTVDAGLADWLTAVGEEECTGIERGDLVSDALARHLADDRDPLVLLVAADASRRRAYVASAARLLGGRALCLSSAQMLSPDLDPARFQRLWRREAILSPRILMLAADEIPQRWSAVLDSLASCVLSVAAIPALDTARRHAVVRAPAHDLGARFARWQSSFPSLPREGALRLAAEYLHAPERLHGAETDERSLAAVCRLLTGAALAGLAEKVETEVAWNDLVLPPDAAALLRDIAAHAGTRVVVNEAWGFRSRGGRGNGVTALFAGPPGTGKTLAARVIAAELGRDLYRVDLSRTVSKYVGETEKNLARVFDAAERGGAVLLFDEADALFGKRSEVRDSHDRYANLEVAYLLQRMESFSGLAILTTNLDQAIDPAFARRLAFVVRFPFPSEAARRDIWSRAFPTSTPTAHLDAARLARIPLAGGHIANIAWSAACRALHEGAVVGESQVVAAARAECAKLERPWQESWLGAAR